MFGYTIRWLGKSPAHLAGKRRIKNTKQSNFVILNALASGNIILRRGTKWSRRSRLPLSTARRKTKLQSKIPAAVLVEQKTGIFFVFCTPLLERKIQKALKNAKKIKAENVSRETFHALSCGYLSKSTHHKEAMRRRIASPSAIANVLLHNDWLHNILDKESVIYRLLTGQSMIQRQRCNESLHHRGNVTR